MPHALTTMANVICPHGGQAILVTTQTKVDSQSALWLLETDIHVVAGCPLIIVLFPSPCVRIEWASGTTRNSIFGTPILTRASQGSCYNSFNGLQGMAIVVSTQMRADPQ